MRYFNDIKNRESVIFVLQLRYMGSSKKFGHDTSTSHRSCALSEGHCGKVVTSNKSRRIDEDLAKKIFVFQLFLHLCFFLMCLTLFHDPVLRIINTGS